MCSSINYPYLPHRRDLFQDPHPTPLEIPIKLHTFHQYYWLLRPPHPHPQECSIPWVGAVWTFSVTTQYHIEIYQNTVTRIKCTRCHHQYFRFAILLESRPHLFSQCFCTKICQDASFQAQIQCIILNTSSEFPCFWSQQTESELFFEN